MKMFKVSPDGPSCTGITKAAALEWKREILNLRVFALAGKQFTVLIAFTAPPHHWYYLYKNNPFLRQCGVCHLILVICVRIFWAPCSSVRGKRRNIFRLSMGTVQEWTLPTPLPLRLLVQVFGKSRLHRWWTQSSAIFCLGENGTHRFLSAR
jgi:hypothetical protein